MTEAHDEGGESVVEYDAEDAKRDLDLLGRKATDAEAANRLAEYIGQLEARAASAERVCFAAAEVAAPTVKRDLMQQRQTRFLRALAEWRALQERV